VQTEAAAEQQRPDVGLHGRLAADPVPVHEPIKQRPQMLLKY
jgi:hypothetical protein